LIARLGEVNRIAVDPAGETLYWTSGPERCPLEGDPDCPHPQAVVHAVPVTGGPTTDLVTAIDGGEIAVAGDVVLFTADIAPAGPRDLLGIPRQGGPTSLVAAGLPDGFVVGDSRVYWGADDGVHRADLDGADPRLVVAGDRPFAVAVDDGHVYWSDPAGLWRADGDGNTVEAIAPVSTSQMLVRGDFVYAVVASSPRTSIVRIPVDGGGFGEVLAGDEYRVGSLAADDHHVYWSDPQHGAIRRSRLSAGPAESLIVGAPQPAGLVRAAPGIYYWVAGGDVYLLPL